MKDRIPTYPGRVKLTQVSGNIYDLERADQPSEAGTPLNKASLLKDATAALFGLTDTAVPDDVFALIASGRAKIEAGSYVGTGTKGESNPTEITFAITPKILVVYRADGYVYTIYPYTVGADYLWTVIGNGSSPTACTATVTGTTVSWWTSANSSLQLNDSGTTYYYCAIGV